MRSKKDLEAVNRGGEFHFGYVSIDMFPCPPFLMFSNKDDCPVCWRQLAGKAFETQSMILWCNLVRGATAVVDVGAQVGAYCLSAAALRSDIAIHAFEPNPDGFARLAVNIIANDFANLHLHREAIAHKKAVNAFTWVPKYFGHISAGGRLGASEHPDATEIFVRMTTLDEALAGHDLGTRPIMKMDIEGAEYLALKGMPKILASRPDILLEVFDADPCAQITALMSPLGYRFFAIDDVNLRVEPRPALEPRETASASRNQLLTFRSDEEVAALARR